MAAPGDINLIRTKTRLSPEMILWSERLRIISLIALIGSIAVGLVTGAAFLEIQRERSQVADDKDRYLRTISQMARKESLFQSLQSRIPITQRVLNSQRPWSAVMDTVGAIAMPPMLYGLSVDDHGIVLMNMKTHSLSDVSDWIAKITDLVGKKTIRSPQLASFQLSEDGTIIAGFSFIPQ